MLEKMKKVQLNKKQTDLLFYLSLVLVALFAFLLIGSGEPVLFDDSGAYLRVKAIEGVMPVYPLFLLVNQFLFGDDCYLRVVIVEQAVLAAASVISFTAVIRRKFTLAYWESYVVFFLSLLPFTIDMPDAMSTQEILTEGIAYALFYPFMIALLQAVWKKSYKWLTISFLMILLLSMTRSQLQMLFGTVGIVFLYIILCKKGQGKKKFLFGRLIGGLLGCAVISLVGILLISGITSGYKYMIRYHEKFNVFVMKVQDQDQYRKYLQKASTAVREEEVQQAELEEIEGVQEAAVEKTQSSTEELAKKSFATSQYVSLIFSRGMYEADPEDAELFEDEAVKGLYLALYDAADDAGQRYAYEQKGLWMWKDIVGGIGLVGKTCLMIPSEYYAVNYPEIIESDDFSSIRNEHLQTIGMTLLKAHFGRFLYHTLMLLPSAFICTVFFQIAPIYGLCHLVTLFLYLSAAALMIWGYADKRVERKYAEFMTLVLGVNVVMVVLISLVFFGQQRYLVYNFGIFYVAYGLLLQQLWKCRMKEWICRKYRDRN